MTRLSTKVVPEDSPPMHTSSDDANAGPLRVMTTGCAAVADAEPQALGVTYWFDAASEGEPYPVTVRFSGRRVGVKGRPRPVDSFVATEAIERVVPGSGRISITTRVFDLAPGQWNVTVTAAGTAQRGVIAPAGAKGRPRLPNASSSGTTSYAPVVRTGAPGARFGVWPALVSLGVLVALSTQALLVSRARLHEARIVLVSLVASLVGLLGAKLYYIVEHRGDRERLVTAGMCIQGFVVGAIGTVIIGALVTALPVGRLLDLTAPGLLFAMTIGRFGCFFGGCCAGRPTASRWGLWSSDRRLGVRRVPTQLLESAVALIVGLSALLAVLTTTPHPAGVLFVGALAAYTLGRQLMFPCATFPAIRPTAARSRPSSPRSSWLSTSHWLSSLEQQPSAEVCVFLTDCADGRCQFFGRTPSTTARAQSSERRG